MYSIGDFVLAKGYHDIRGSTEKPFKVAGVKKIVLDLKEKEVEHERYKSKIQIKGKHYREEWWLKCQRDNGDFLNLPNSLIIGKAGENDQDLPW